MKGFCYISFWLTGLVTLLVCISCSPRRYIGVSEDERLQHSYTGHYRSCERITIGFGSEGRFACEFNSEDLVGHFTDVVWGTYTTDSTHIYLHPDKVNKDNLNYKSLPLYVNIADSILFTESGDSLIIFFKESYPSDEKESVLSPSAPIKSFSTGGNTDDLLLIFAIFGLGTYLSHVFLLLLAGLIVWLIVRIVKKRV